jgi:hypothetical protein
VVPLVDRPVVAGDPLVLGAPPTLFVDPTVVAPPAPLPVAPVSLLALPGELSEPPLQAGATTS